MTVLSHLVLLKGATPLTTWLQKYAETIIDSGYYKLLLEGLQNTLIITIGALIIGVLIGTLISVI